MKTVRKYQVVAKVGANEYNLELRDNRLEAEKLAEEYALGKEAVFAEPWKPDEEKPGHICVTFIPTHKLDGVYVIPKDVPVKEEASNG